MPQRLATRKYRRANRLKAGEKKGGGKAEANGAFISRDNFRLTAARVSRAQIPRE
jgi:hypothetical protein